MSTTPHMPHVLDLRTAPQSVARVADEVHRTVASNTHSHVPALRLSPFRHGARTQYRVVTLSLVRMGALLTLICTGSYGLHAFGPSLAYFTDTEGAPANSMSSGILTIDAEGGGDAGLSCNDDHTFPVSVSLDTTRASAYTVWVEQAAGSDTALCDALTVEATLDGVERYDGDLLALGVADVGSGGEWEFAVETGDVSGIANGAQCTVAVVFEAYCPALGFSGGGFTDRDAVMLSVTKESCGEDEPCEPGCCGDVTIEVENTNIGSITNDMQVHTSTGGNTVSGGGTVVTGNATTNSSIVNMQNINTIDIEAGCSCTTPTQGCACGQGEDAAVPQAPEPDTDEPDTVTPTSPHTTDTIDEIRAQLDERLRGLRGR